LNLSSEKLVSKFTFKFNMYRYTMVGTFGYCAPEQMLGGVTPVSDLYSAGATLLFLLSGRAPSTMPQSRLKINFRGVVTIDSARLEALVARLLEPAAEDRFQTAGEALRVLTGPDLRGRGGSMGRRNFRGRSDGDDNEASSSSSSERRPWEDLDLAGLDGRGRGEIVPGVFPEQGGGISLQRGGMMMEEGDRMRPRQRIRTPAGTRVIVEREGKSKLLIVIPPQGLTLSSAGTGAFAIAWNGGAVQVELS
jgi:serine/threonine protein kinase